jgi:hypothetical protein
LIILNKSNPTLTCQSFFNLTTFSELKQLLFSPQLWTQNTFLNPVILLINPSSWLSKGSKTVPYGNTTLDILRTLNTIQKLALPTMTGLKTLHQSRNVQTPYIKILSKFEKELHDFCKVNPAKSSPSTEVKQLIALKNQISNYCIPTNR